MTKHAPATLLRLRLAKSEEIQKEIRKFQNAQKCYSATSEIHAEIGKQLAPLFAEMARRQKEGTL